MLTKLYNCGTNIDLQLSLIFVALFSSILDTVLPSSWRFHNVYYQPR